MRIQTSVQRSGRHWTIWRSGGAQRKPRRRARPSGTARSLTSPGADACSHARHWPAPVGSMAMKNVCDLEPRTTHGRPAMPRVAARGFCSRAENCRTFDARDRTPRPSRATAHYPVENAPTATRAPSRASGFVPRRIPDSRVVHTRSTAAFQEKFCESGRCAVLFHWIYWRPLPDSNRCCRRERAVSWASRRRGRGIMG